MNEQQIQDATAEPAALVAEALIRLIQVIVAQVVEQHLNMTEQGHEDLEDIPF